MRSRHLFSRKREAGSGRILTGLTGLKGKIKALRVMATIFEFSAPASLNSPASDLWQTDSKNPGPNVQWTLVAHPMISSVWAASCTQSPLCFSSFNPFNPVTKSPYHLSPSPSRKFLASSEPSLAAVFRSSIACPRLPSSPKATARLKYALPSSGLSPMTLLKSSIARR